MGAANAYAADAMQEVRVADAADSRIWTYQKTAVSEAPPVLRTVVKITEPLPDVVVPLNSNFEIAETGTVSLDNAPAYDMNADLRNFDLVEDSPVFIGARGPTEFDTLEARRDSGAFPDTLGVNPFFTVAGAGVATSF